MNSPLHFFGKTPAPNVGAFSQRGNSPCFAERRPLCLLLVFLVAFSLFAQTIFFESVWDDADLIDNAVRSFEEGGFSSIIRSRFDLKSEEGNVFYRPLVLLSLAVDSITNPFFRHTHHFTNVVLHSCNSALVYAMLLLLTGSAWGALTGGLYFAVTPIHVEAVAFISSRGDLLATFFSLLAVISLMMRRRSGRSPFLLGLSSFFFVLACLSKEVSYLLPVVMLALEALYPVSKDTDGHSKRYEWVLPWALAFAVVVILRLGVAGIASSTKIAPQTVQIARSLMGTIFLTYFKLLVVPWPLNPSYLPENIKLTLGVMAGGSAFLVLSILALLKNWRIGIMVIGWTLLFLLPVSWIIPAQGLMFIAERYLYLPSVSAAILVASFFMGIESHKGLRRVLLALFVPITALMMAGSHQGAKAWRNDIALYSAMTETAAHFSFPHYNLAIAYERNKEYMKALEAYRRAGTLKPPIPEIPASIGRLESLLGKDGIPPVR
jgi:hypothetical protein